MSAQFFLQYRGHWIRTLLTREDTCELVAREQATPFASEAEAWLAAARFQLEPDFCEVKS